jgi:DNA-binding NtrC family response regulator
VPRIFLFEDNEGLRDLLLELLQEELGAHVDSCGSIAQLREKCAADGPPDLIVADFWGTSHLRLADSERSEIGSLAAIAPLVLVSARNWALDEQATELGVVALVPKPLDIEGFLTVIRAALAPLDAAASEEQPMNLPQHEAMSVFVLGWP